ncbi:MAG: GAF domain-containing protein [Anaerolineales bacterium]
MNRFITSVMARLRQNHDGRQLIYFLLAAQIAAILGAIPGVLSILFNAEFSDAQLKSVIAVVPVAFVVNFAATMYITWRFTFVARKRLDDIANKRPDADNIVVLEAWREITNFPIRIVALASIISFVVIVLPAVGLTSALGETIASPFQPNSLTSPVPLYVFLGGTAAILGWAILCILLTERVALPFRLILVPSDFETQRKGRAGALIVGKVLILILAMIAIAILLIGPIGYQQTIRILYSEVSSLDVFRDLRTQTILFTALALALGIGYSYFVSKSISDPIRGLIESFDKVEAGNLSARAPITATDELGLVTMHFNRTIARLEVLQNSLEQQVAERTKLLEVSNEVGRVASSSLDPNELLSRVIHLFTDRFGYYFAAIYLLDPSEKWAEIHEATGEVGKLLKQNHQRHEISGKSMVGSAIRDKSPKIAQIAQAEKERFQNPLLPYTRSEIALPLFAGNHVFGALDVQSTKEADFGPEAVRTMQSMVGQISVALENARLFQTAQQNIREMRAIQQQYLLTGWSEISNPTEEMEYGVGDELDTSAKQVEVPISLRDQILGQIQLEDPELWTAEQENLVNAVASQAAVALENARLVSESRQTALRERMIAEINSKIWSSVTIDGVLQTAAKELGRRLDASRATIELKIEETK